MLKRSFRFLCCLLALALLLSATAAFAAAEASIKGYVTANTKKVYQYPSPLSKTMGIMSYGESVQVLAAQDGWLRLKNSKGQIGYCEYGGLSTKNPALNTMGYVKESGAYVYAKPGLSYKVIAKVKMGDTLHVVGMTKDGEWLRLQNGSRYGYIPTDMVSKTPTWFGNGLSTVTK